MKFPVYNIQGEVVREVDLSDKVFNTKVSPSAVHQVVVAMQANVRAGTAHTKTRGEVRGGGKKPWRQKGTGRARHGSIRSPLWRKGGVVFGPLKVRNYQQKINSSLRKAALRSILSDKVQTRRMVVVDQLPKEMTKTKEAYAFLATLKEKVSAFSKFVGRKNEKKQNQALLLTETLMPSLVLAMRNLPSVKVEEARNANPKDLITYQVCVLEEKAIPALERLATK